MLTTERLIIRPFQEDDYHDLYEYLSLKETYRFEPGESISLEEAKKLCLERAKGTDFWAVTLKDRNKKLIGHVSFIPAVPLFFKTWEIGYIFNPAFQNKGYATEAARAIIAHAFTEQKAHRIVGYCAPDNIASWRVLEKCGMKREGLLRENVFFHKDENDEPIWLDSYVYSALTDDIE